MSQEVCDDWEQREFISSMEDALIKIVGFLNRFEKSCRFKLASVNARLESLDRKLDYVQHCLSQANPQDRGGELVPIAGTEFDVKFHTDLLNRRKEQRLKLSRNALPPLTEQNTQLHGLLSLDMAREQEAITRREQQEALQRQQQEIQRMKAENEQAQRQAQQQQTQQQQQRQPQMQQKQPEQPKPVAQRPVPEVPGQQNRPPPSNRPVPGPPGGPPQPKISERQPESPKAQGPPQISRPLPPGPGGPPSNRPPPGPSTGPPGPPGGPPGPSGGPPGGPPGPSGGSPGPPSGPPGPPGGPPGPPSLPPNWGSGHEVQIHWIHRGTGAPPAQEGEACIIKYVGFLSNGEIFDEAPEDFEFVVGENIEGLEVAVTQMSPGAKAKIWIPSHLAYGEEGAGDMIPPNSDLTFDLEVECLVQN